MNIAAAAGKTSRFNGFKAALCAGFLLAALPIFLRSGAGRAEQTAPIPQPAAKPCRIASICLLGDQLLLELAPREHIAAISYLATDPETSAHWQQARGIPITHDSAEEIVRLNPDLILVSEYSDPLTVSILKRLGFRLLVLGAPNNFDEMRDQIRLVGDTLGEQSRAEQVIAAMDARLQRLAAHRPPADHRPTALFYFQDHFSPGASTFANAILEAAGFRNLAPASASGGEAWVSEESVVLSRPQYLILTHYLDDSPTATQISASQPLFRNLGAGIMVLSVSFRDLVSPDPSNLELAEHLQQCLRQ